MPWEMYKVHSISTGARYFLQQCQVLKRNSHEPHFAAIGGIPKARTPSILSVHLRCHLLPQVLSIFVRQKEEIPNQHGTRKMERFGSDVFFLLFWGDFQVPALQFRGRAPAGTCRFSIEIPVASWYFHISNEKKDWLFRVYVRDEKLPS